MTSTIISDLEDTWFNLDKCEEDANIGTLFQFI